MKKFKQKIFVSILALATVSPFVFLQVVNAESEGTESNPSEFGELDSDISESELQVQTFQMNISEDNLSEDAQEKASNGAFFNEVSTELQSYFELFSEGEISEEELAKLIEENISTKLETPEDELALELSEQEFNDSVMTIFSNNGPIEYTLGKLGANSKEINLFKSNPHKAAKTKNIADVASKEAENRYSKYTLWQGNGDAYRHALWSAIMTMNIDRDWAYRAGYAHENLNPGQATNDLDTKMDISNNYRGRLDGTNYKHLSEPQMLKHVADTVSKGKKVRIRTYTSGKSDRDIAGVKTKYMGKYVDTSDGGRKY